MLFVGFIFLYKIESIPHILASVWEYEGVCTELCDCLTIHGPHIGFYLKLHFPTMDLQRQKVFMIHILIASDKKKLERSTEIGGFIWRIMTYPMEIKKNLTWKGQ